MHKHLQPTDRKCLYNEPMASFLFGSIIFSVTSRAGSFRAAIFFFLIFFLLLSLLFFFFFFFFFFFSSLV